MKTSLVLLLAFSTATFAADPEPPQTEMTTVLVDWPVEYERPRRCAFVYAESQCPPSLQALLAAENAARERERLNALYVAMTRARRQLVISATEPLRGSNAASWWQRLQAVTVAWAPDATASVAGSAAPGDAVVKVPPDYVRQTLTSQEPREQESDRRAAALGGAVHRVLEWAGGTHADTSFAGLAAAAAREFGAKAQGVESVARAILESLECAPFFDRGPIKRARRQNERRTAVFGERMVAPVRAARDLQVKQSLAQPVAAQRLAHYRPQRPARHWRAHGELAQ